MVLRALHLCSGYGGFELALKLAGVPARTVAHVERDAFAAATLVARMADEALDQAPIWADVATFDGRPWRHRVDIVTAGFPCQPFSTAGQQRGLDDARWIWPDIARVVADVGPRFVFLENVPGLVRLGLVHVLSDLASLGFDAEWGLLRASDVGAPHRRERLWLLAHASGDVDDGAGTEGSAPVRRRREQQHADADRVGPHVGHADGTGRPEVAGGGTTVEGSHGRRAERTDVAHDAGEGVADAEGQRREGGVRYSLGTATTLPGPAAGRRFPPPRGDDDGWREWIAGGGPQPSIRRSADGATGRVVRPGRLGDRLHLLGNGLVPQCAAAALVVLADRLGVDLWGG